jgi:tRNA1(Val) A37 N6-methylase TrmN6
MLRARLAFPEAPTSALDPCCGTGAALHALTGGSNTTLYGVELDANRAVSAKESGIQTIQGNVFDVRARVERLSFLYLNPPYDFEVGPRSNERMEKLFLGHTYAWLKPKGILLMVIPCKAVHDVSDTLSTRFKDIAIYRLVGEESEKYDQCAIFGIRHNNNGHDVLPQAATSAHARSRSDV